MNTSQRGRENTGRTHDLSTHTAVSLTCRKLLVEAMGILDSHVGVTNVGYGEKKLGKAE